MADDTDHGATSKGTFYVNYESLTTLKDIDEAYDVLCKEEDVVEEELQDILLQQSQLESKMMSLKNMIPNLQLISGDSQNLSSMIAFTSTLAEHVSSKVRQLDIAKSRVVECMERVEDVLDLKFCTDGVQTALQDEDYEKAAGHVHRFLSLDEHVLRMSAGANEGDTLETSLKLLHEARARLTTIVHRQFDAAVHAADVASVERFFKIFPQLGEHEAGLTKFSKYLCAKIADTADTNLRQALAGAATNKRANVLYADTITLLFEGIARVVEVHQPLVETYYGRGRLITLIEHLQKECDRQARKILEKFKENRQFEMKSRQVQQCLSFQKHLAEDRVNPKELDVLLAEVTLLNARTELYLGFLRRRCLNDLIDENSEDEEDKAAKNARVDQFLVSCDLERGMQELIGAYIMMEEYFMREMVVKAVTMDQTDDSSSQLTSSMVDDAFFIVKKCVRRALSSSSVDGVCAMLNHANAVLEQNFRETLLARLRQGFPSGFDITQAYNLVQSSFQQGKLQYGDAETQKAKAAFLVTLNNAEVSCEYIQTLKSNLEDEVKKLYEGQTIPHANAKIQSCLSDLGAVSSRFKDVLAFGFSQLNVSAVKPRVKPWVDSFLTTSHNITEEEFSIYEVSDPWVQAVIGHLDQLLMSFRGSLTTSNYDTLVSQLSTEISAQLEKSVFKTTFNRLGGLQFDKELRALVGYLTSVTTWTLRDKFSRLTQMATILNLERVAEILDYWGSNSGPLTWRLTPAEVRQVLALRIDFRSEDIKRLKL